MTPLPLPQEMSLTQPLFITAQPSSPLLLFGSPPHHGGMVLGTCLPSTSVNELGVEVLRYSPTHRLAPVTCSVVAGGGRTVHHINLPSSLVSPRS